MMYWFPCDDWTGKRPVKSEYALEGRGTDEIAARNQIDFLFGELEDGKRSGSIEGVGGSLVL